MTKLENILFTDGDFETKKSYIDDMIVDDLMSVEKSLVKRIIEKCGNEYNTLWIDSKRRQGNNRYSLVESVSIHDGDVLVGIYVQNDSTDTSTSERFDKFFRRGEYYSRNNNLNIGVDYKEGDKADVMRSILLECVYQQFNDEVLREKLIEKITHYSIINPVLNHFYKLWDLWHREISKYSSRDTVVKNKGYHYAERKIKEYARENVLDLVGKTNEELQEIYKEVFQKAYDEFDKSFDFNKWKSECTLWY